MFTGLVETTGIIKSRTMNGNAGKLAVLSKKKFHDLQQGESIAVNGTCLTLEKGMNGGVLVFHVMRETFSRTNIGSLSIGSEVNLERALPADGRLGGHIVSGHVDGISKILSIRHRDSDLEITLQIPDGLEDYFVEKGSVAINGISLTVESVDGAVFRVGIIPTTWRETMLHSAKEGDEVNIETDLLGKYVVNYLKRTKENRKELSLQMLAEAGIL